MSWADLVNAGFEAGMVPTIGLSVFALYRDKRVAGVHWFQFAFVTAWGAWNLYYYPSLDQWASFWAGVGVFGINLWYTTAMLYYLRFPGGRQ